MKARAIVRHFRNFKLVYAPVLISLCMVLGLSLLTFGFLYSADEVEGTYRPLLIKAGILLIIQALLVVAWIFRSFKLLSKLASCDRAIRRSEYLKAQAYANVAWQYAQTLQASDSLYGMTLANLTRVARLQGNYDDAESFGQKWVWASEQAWGSDHPNVVYAIREFAETYLDIARYDQAQPLLEKALSFWESTPRPDLLAMALCLGALGRLWHQLDRNDKAEAYLRRAYAIVQDRRIDDALAGMTIAHGLASAFAYQGKLAEAETLVRTFLERIEKTFAPESHIVAATLYQFALIRFLQRRYAEGEPMARRALSIIQKITRNNELALAMYCSLLGRLLTALAQLDEAEVLLRLALRSREEYLAPEHPFVAESLECYAQVLKAQGRFLEATEFVHRAEQIRAIHAPRRND